MRIICSEESKQGEVKMFVGYVIVILGFALFENKEWIQIDKCKWYAMNNFTIGMCLQIMKMFSQIIFLFIYW